MEREWVTCLSKSGKTCVPLRRTCSKRQSVLRNTSAMLGRWKQRGPLAATRARAKHGGRNGGWAGCAQVLPRFISERVTKMLDSGAALARAAWWGAGSQRGTKSCYRLLGGHDSYAWGACLRCPSMTLLSSPAPGSCGYGAASQPWFKTQLGTHQLCDRGNLIRPVCDSVSSCAKCRKCENPRKCREAAESPMKGSGWWGRK